MSEYDYGDEFYQALLKAMLEPVNEKSIEPCCDLFGKSLHHHWKTPENSEGGDILYIPESLEFPEDV